jgi:hypothetical protein
VKSGENCVLDGDEARHGSAISRAGDWCCMVALEQIKPRSRLRGLDPEGVAEVVQDPGLVLPSISSSGSTAVLASVSIVRFRFGRRPAAPSL